MLKKSASSLLAAAMLAGCSGTAATASSEDIDTAKTASSLVDELKLNDTVSLIEESRIVMGLFFFDEDVVTESSVYIADNSSADIVGVFKTADTESCEASIKEYLATQKEQMQNYYPDEVFKIDNAYLKDNGSVVILIVCNDIEKAKKAADSILGIE